MSNNQTTKKYVAGIDIGSLMSKAVVLSGNGHIVSFELTRTVYDSLISASNVIKGCLEKGGLDSSQLSYIVATGYGRVNVPFANKAVTEIICHARGVNRLFPSARTIVDMGGQDSKVISIRSDGRVRKFVMNDRCAAGTGRFLEVMSSALGVGLSELGDLAATSPQRPRISSVCTVFAESEIIGMMARAVPKQWIAGGLCEAIAARIYQMLVKIEMEEDFVMTGGGAKNGGIVKILSEKIGHEFLVPEEPQMTGALGAALIAMDLTQIGQKCGEAS